MAIYEFQLKNQQTQVRSRLIFLSNTDRYFYLFQKIENVQTEFNKDELYAFFEKVK